MILNFIVIFSAFVAIVIPIVFGLSRQSTKKHRQGIIKNLSGIFDKEHTNDPAFVHSFEFVKYKYYIGNKKEGDNEEKDFKIGHWAVSAVPLIVILFCLNILCTSIVIHTAFRIPIPAGVSWLSGTSKPPLFAWIILSSYVGAMLFMLRAFNQAINNFDLSPLSFIGAATNLMFGIASGLLIIFGVSRILDRSGNLWASPSPSLFSAFLVGAFTAGYFPDLAVRNILRVSQLKNYKKENTQIYQSFKAVPIEIIDGIDLDVRARLADYHISTVQNLAAVNPLMLFVETPYGVYEIMDWVAQAQLCSSVGPTALPKFWRLGIRTIFDLERVALDPACTDDVLIQEIGAIIWQTPKPVPITSPGQAKPDPWPPLSAIKANIRFRLESPHVHRLRQIFNHVGKSLGNGAKRLPPVLDCPMGDLRSCPFLPKSPAASGGAPGQP